MKRKITLLSLTFSVLMGAMAQLQIVGENSLCKGSVRQYYITPAGQYSNILWQDPAGGSIVEGIDEDTVSIQWTSNVGSHLGLTALHNNSSTVQSATIFVDLFPTPEPSAISNYAGGCGELFVKTERRLKSGRDGESSLNDCQSICENSVVRYYAVGLNGSSYQWILQGSVGTIVQNYPNGDSVDILFNQLGYGQLFIEETSAQACVGRSTFCVEVVEVPQASIETLLPQQNDSIAVCLNQSIQFLDASTTQGIIPIVNYSWYIDGTIFSGEEDPSYVFDNAGWHYIDLVVSNLCGCTDTAQLWVNVNPNEGPIIEGCICPRCEMDTTHFTSPTHCSSYVWASNGGTILSGQGTNQALVQWNQINSSAMASISLHCPSAACPVPTIISYPILTDQAQIEGPTAVCDPDTGNVTYSYKVPFWQGANYTWTISPNPGAGYFEAFPYQSNNIRNLRINAGSSTTQYTITVNYEHPFLDCSGSDTISVSVSPALEMAGKAIVCAGEKEVWRAMPYMPNDNQYTWYLDDTLIASNTTGEWLHTFSTAGFHTLIASHPDFCDEARLIVEVLDIPPSPSPIQGDTAVCLNFSYEYSSLPSAADYYLDWTIIDGNDTLKKQGSQIVVNWQSYSGPYILQVQQVYHNGSCPSEAVEQIIQPYQIPAPLLLGPDTVCANSMSEFTVQGAERIIYSDWELINGGEAWGNYITYNDTFYQVQWNNIPYHQYMSGTIRCKIKICNDLYILNKQVYIGPAPEASIDYTGNLCPGESIQFSQGNSAITSGTYAWDFDDGNTASSASVSHTYAQAGSYFVSLTVTAPNGCTSTQEIVEPIHINNPPVAAANLFYGELDYGCAPIDTGVVYAVLRRVGQFNPHYSYWWYKTTGNTHPSPADSIAGTLNQDTLCIDYRQNQFTQALRENYGIMVRDTNGCWGFSAENTLKINTCNGNGTGNVCIQDPQNSIATHYSRQCNQVQLQGTILPDSTIAASWKWYADYQQTTFTHLNPSFSYPVAGMYRPYLEVEFYCLDSAGNAGTETYVVKEKLPMAIPVVPHFEVRFACDSAGQMQTQWIDASDFVSFNPNTLDGTQFVQTHWRITNNQGNTTLYSGVGTTPPTAMPAGNYWVELEHIVRFRNQNLGIDQTDTCHYADSISVPQTAQAAFVIDTTVSCEGQPVQFIDQSSPSAQIIRWHWNFDDGQSSLLQNPVRGYKFTGNQGSCNYTPTLTITDQYGCNSQASAGAVQIYPHKIDGILIPNVSCGLAEIVLNITDLNYPPSRYIWNTGDTTLHPANSLQTTQVGHYWVRIEDEVGCYKNIGPVSVGIPQAPSAIIYGKQRVCSNEKFQLTGPGGAGLSYQWQRLNNSSWLDLSSTGIQVEITSSSNITAQPVADFYRLLLHYTDPQTNASCTDTSEVYEVEVRPFIYFPNIHLQQGICQLPVQLEAVYSQGAQSINDFVVSWNTGDYNTTTTTANYYGEYIVTLTDSFGCSVESKMILPTPYHFDDLPIGCWEICDTILPYTLSVPKYFYQWAWLYNGQVYSSGTNSIPNLTIVDSTMAGEWVLQVKERIWNGSSWDTCANSSESIQLSIIDCDNPCLPTNPTISIEGDSVFCLGVEDSLQLNLTGFDYAWGNMLYLNDSLVGEDVASNPSYIGLNYSDTILYFPISDDMPEATITYCIIVSSDSVGLCMDTLCFSFSIINCCDTSANAMIALPEDTICYPNHFMLELGYGNQWVQWGIPAVNYQQTLHLGQQSNYNNSTQTGSLLLSSQALNLLAGNTYTLYNIAYPQGDTTNQCADTAWTQLYVEENCSGCDSLDLVPQITYQIEQGRLLVQDISFGVYELIQISYNGQNYIGLPGDTTSFPMNNFMVSNDLCITIIEFVGDQCCKRTYCTNIQANCDDLKLEANFTAYNYGNQWNFQYTGNQPADVLLWTFPDGSQMTAAVASDSSILTPQWYDNAGKGGKVCLKAIVHLSADLCCVAEYCTEINPKKDPCESLQLQTSIQYQNIFSQANGTWEYHFSPLVSNWGPFTYLESHWHIFDAHTGQNITHQMGWNFVHTFPCEEKPQSFTVVLVMVALDERGNPCEFKIEIKVEVPPCKEKVVPKIYPNPAHNFLTIDMQGIEWKDSYLQIYDPNGKVLFENPISANQSKINIKNWVKGNYLIRIQTKDEKFQYKVLKNK